MSYITVTSHQARQMGTQLLEWIKNQQRERIDQLVQFEITRQTNSRWRKFWKKPIPTKEEAYAYLKKYEIGTESDYEITRIECGYGEEKNLANSLITAAELSPEVQVSFEDLASLWMLGP